jgi:hypothetical protein
MSDDVRPIYDDVREIDEVDIEMSGAVRKMCDRVRQIDDVDVEMSGRGREIDEARHRNVWPRQRNL